MVHIIKSPQHKSPHPSIHSMATFEEVVQAAQRDHEFEMIHEMFTELVENSDQYRLCQRIFPFLAHVNDGGQFGCTTCVPAGLRAKSDYSQRNDS